MHCYKLFSTRKKGFKYYIKLLLLLAAWISHCLYSVCTVILIGAVILNTNISHGSTIVGKILI